MMKESSVSSLDTSRSMTWNFKQTQKKQKITINAKCIQGQLTTTLCVSKYCNKNAFICDQAHCLCHNAHQNCFKMPIKEFTNKIQKKILNIDEFIDFHDKKVDEFIDLVIDEASKVKKAFKTFAQQKYKYSFLSQNELKMFLRLKQNKVQEISGENCNQLFVEMDFLSSKPQKLSIQKQFDKIQKQWKAVQNVCKNQLQLMTLQLKDQFFIPQQKKFFNQSKIVKDWNQKEKIFKFFNKKIKQVKLIYRASQNAFKVDIFYKLTKGIKNTLTLIETQFDKKIGGFTPLQWRQVQKNQLFADNSNSTFIFSLSNNQKFEQKDLNSGIQYFKEYGPRFNGIKNSSDLAIYNESNNNNNCYISLNKGFVHKNYSQQNKQRNKKFLGSPNNQSSFKTKQWQVWQVTFY